MSDTLRSAVIKLAHVNPELRPHLLPILAAQTKTASTHKEYTERKKSEGEKPLDEKAWEARTKKIKHHEHMADLHEHLGTMHGHRTDAEEDHERARMNHEKAAKDPDKKNHLGFTASQVADHSSNSAMATHHREQAEHLKHVGRSWDAAKHEDAAKAHAAVGKGSAPKHLSDIEKESKAAWKLSNVAHRGSSRIQNT